MIAFVFGASRYLLIEARFAPFHDAFAAIYTQRPAIDAADMDEWIGPWHVRRVRSNPSRRYLSRRYLSNGNFAVQLGGGFVLLYADHPDRSAKLVVQRVD